MLKYTSALLLTFILAPPLAQAHLMPAGKGTVNLVGSLAYLAISLPVNSFPVDGETQVSELSPEVLKKKERFFKTCFREHVHIKFGAETAEWAEVLFSVNPKHKNENDETNEIIVMAIAKFKEPPKNISIRSELWGIDPKPIELMATITEAGRVVKSQAALLSKKTPEALLFQ